MYTHASKLQRQTVKKKSPDGCSSWPAHYVHSGARCGGGGGWHGEASTYIVSLGGLEGN